MLNFIRASRRAAGAPRVPEGLRVYAVGDIHGRADLLRRLHARIAEDAAADPGPTMQIVYLGDYVDRGFDSRQVIEEFLTRPLAGFDTVFLKGNHDLAMLNFLTAATNSASWLLLGGDATLHSYGVAPPYGIGEPEQLASLQARFAAAVPPDHRRFLETLRPMHRVGDYLFVHAGIRPRVPLERQRESDLLWIREEFTESKVDHGVTVVHGHSVTVEPDIRPNRIGIDTGAYATGRLTCLVLQDDRRRFIQT